MAQVSVVGPNGGEPIQLGPTPMRILEDGSTTGLRLGVGEITLAPHTFANPTDATTVLLNTFTPDLYVQYFRDLRDMIAGAQPLTAEATIEAMSRYATEPASDFA
jgi:hypothetical protein